MNNKEYQKFVEEGAHPSYDDKLAIVGLVGEVGELADVVKKKCIYEDMSRFERKFGMTIEEKIKDEAGDVLWQYVLVLCRFGISIDDVMEYNVRKLRARHKDGIPARDGGNR